MKSVYIETSIASYLTARPSRDLRAAAWQQTTLQWWEQERPKYELFTSELVLVEARAGDADAAGRRLAVLDALPLLSVTDEAKDLADRLMADGGMPPHAEADALHIAVASVHGMGYLLTWNCRHIDNATTKPVIRSICAVAGYTCPEICTPLELLSEEVDDVQG
jgi:predicted nucleic acid-binding protein